MSTQTTSNNPSNALAGAHYTTDFVTSKDGTTIGYRQLGHGPGVVLVQGAMGSAHQFMQLAGALADAFTVYVPDRRGRGISPLPFSKDYSIQKDVEDLDALLTKTGTHAVFGVSSGALISLQAALTLPAIQKIALYEPPLYPRQGLPTALIARYERAMARGKVVAALIAAMKAAQMGPPILQSIPDFLLEPLFSMVVKSEDKKGSGDYIPMRNLAPALLYDFHVVVEMSGTLENFRAIHPRVLLLGGSKSPAYLKSALAVLEQVLPQVTRVEFPGLDHGSTWNYDKQRNPSGKPEQVAQELRRFFAEP